MYQYTAYFGTSENGREAGIEQLLCVYDISVRSFSLDDYYTHFS